MDNYLPPKHGTEEAIISCDSCQRSSSQFSTTKCIGGPICERCALNGFDCIFSPGEARIEGLKNAFSTLLIPGMERPRTPSPPRLSSFERRFEETLENERRHREGDGDKIVESTDKFEKANKGELHTCTTCQIWNSPHCDLRNPTCSSCEVRGVECIYPFDSFSSQKYMSSQAVREREPKPYSEELPNHWQAPTPTQTTQASSPPQAIPSLTTLHDLTHPMPEPRRKSKSKSKQKPPPTSPPLQLQKLDMYSTPSGCTTCFSTKQKCIPGKQNEACVRCVLNNQAQSCLSFPANTKLVPCSTCVHNKKPCTNNTKGLQCDGCEEEGLECSRAISLVSADKDKPKHLRVSKDNGSGEFKFKSESGGKGKGTRCLSCISLDLSCTHSGTSTGGCFPCREFGLVCTQSFDVASDREFAVEREGKEEACTSCQDLGLGCDLMLPMCFYCGELGAECSLARSLRTEEGKKGDVRMGDNVKIGVDVEVGLPLNTETGTGVEIFEGEKVGKKEEGVKGKDQKEVSEDDEEEDWEEITYTETLPAGKAGEFGVLELDDVK